VNVSVSAVIRGFDCWKEGVLILSYSAFVNLNRLFFHIFHIFFPHELWGKAFFPLSFYSTKRWISLAVLKVGWYIMDHTFFHGGSEYSWCCGTTGIVVVGECLLFLH